MLPMRRWKIALFVLMVSSAAFACDLKYDPASLPQFYREKGWTLPGIKDEGPWRSDQHYDLPIGETIPGVKASIVVHQFPYIVSFPKQEFLLNGTRQRLRSMQVKASIVRLKVDDRVIAYSYGLIPVSARKKNGKWVISTEMGCMFSVTFIDDRGDGVFRLLVPNGLTPDLVPRWAKPKKS
jgi:hypothetical protein